jgi:hypothetical protein
VEVALAVRDAVNAGESLASIASSLQLTPSMVSRFLRLLDLNADVRHLVDWGPSGLSTVGFTSASELTRLPREDQAVAVPATLEHRLSSADVKQLVQLRLRSSRTIQECIDSTLKMRPTVERVHVILGSVSPDNQAPLAKLPQATRDALFRPIVLELFPGLETLGARLGSTRFTISGDERLDTAVKKQPEFEAIINRALSERL